MQTTLADYITWADEIADAAGRLADLLPCSDNRVRDAEETRDHYRARADRARAALAARYAA